jgi:hypothetical protein
MLSRASWSGDEVRSSSVDSTELPGAQPAAEMTGIARSTALAARRKRREEVFVVVMVVDPSARRPAGRRRDLVAARVGLRPCGSRAFRRRRAVRVVRGASTATVIHDHPGSGQTIFGARYRITRGGQFALRA